jgi:hypothetical protein
MESPTVVRIRVVDETHPAFGQTATVPLAAFERAARQRSQGRLKAEFESGAMTVAFAQVELEPEEPTSRRR